MSPAPDTGRDARLQQVINTIYATRIALAEKRRLAGRAVAHALSFEPGAVMSDPDLLRGMEHILMAIKHQASLDAKPTVTLAKDLLRGLGPHGTKLASRVGRISSKRNAVAHPDEVQDLIDDIGRLKFPALQDSDATAIPQDADTCEQGMSDVSDPSFVAFSHFPQDARRSVFALGSG